MCSEYYDAVSLYPVMDNWKTEINDGDFGECSSNFYQWIGDEFNVVCDDVFSNPDLPLNEEFISYCLSPQQITSNNYEHIFTTQNSQEYIPIGHLSTSDDSNSFPRLPYKRPGRPKGNIQQPNKDTNKKMGKLWEFLRNLLMDERTCPSLIKWDNYNEGTFKFVQSEKVAQLWGNRKNNTKMNYEKLSRAMRYYYRSQVLLPVTGKRLVYKFGPQATGWRTQNPIL